MDGISDSYQSQVKHYRNTHFGDDPTLIRNIKYGLRSVFSSVIKERIYPKILQPTVKAC